MSSATPQAAQDQQTEATILRIDFDQRSGWYTIQTDQGEFSTKFPEPAQEAQQYVGQRVSLVYQQSEPRQGRNGQWYQSRYLRRIVASYTQPQLQGPTHVSPPPPGVPQQVWDQATGPQQQQLATGQSVTREPIESGDREMRIMRQTAGKLAVQTMALVPSEHRGFGNQVMVAEAWVRYFMGGPSAVDAPTTLPTPTQPAEPVSDDIPW